MYKPKLNSTFNLEDFTLDESLLKITLPGDLITDEEGYMKYLFNYLVVMVHIHQKGKSILQF